MAKIHESVPKHSATGEKWKSHATIMRHLKVDFNGRCAYCGDSDALGGEDYHIDHFAPKEKFPSLKYVYDNLMYACPYCNRAKSDYWVCDKSSVNIIGNEGILDPCQASYNDHLARNQHGQIYPITKLGDFMYRKLKLYLDRHRIFHNIETIREKIDSIQCTDDKTMLSDLLMELMEYYRLSTIIKSQPGVILKAGGEI